ncbi:MAG TPA: FAD-binding protein [Patescibacteria group bacterium]|nr:FAD-binding protein [Patescibacteria group bacterium]
MTSDGLPLEGLTNWSGNVTYGAARLHEPGSLDELQAIVRSARSLRVLGSRHSFSAIADTPGDLVSLRRLPRRFELDPARATVTVDGAVRYGELGERLDAAGFALHNLASLPHISVAGACATATHGSGDRSGNLATAVRSVEVVTADGELVRFDRDVDGRVFEGVVVSLGGLGAVTSLTLDVAPTFRMRQDLYENLPMARVVTEFDEITASADSVSLFTEWRGGGFEQVWLKRRVMVDDGFEPAPDFFGATRATGPIHPIPGMPTTAVTEQLGSPGPWHERMPHFRMDHTPSSGAELQSEYLVPREHVADALLALDAIRTRFARLVQTSEVRTIAADRLWMSTAEGRASAAIHFTWRPDETGVRAVLPDIEAALLRFQPRPHWGKCFSLAPEIVRASYRYLAEFGELLRRHDPEGVFRNPFLDRYIPG